MSGLRDLQSCFRDAIIGGDSTAIEAGIRTDGLSASRGLDIYRNNVFTNQREALRTIYAVVDRLVGGEFFDHLANEYVRRYSSPAGDLNRLGKHLAEFLEQFEPAAGLVYLPDTARLEWCAHRVYHGSEHPSLNVERLARVSPDRYGEIRFRLHPAAALVASAFPVHRVWQVNQPGYAGESTVDLGDGGVRLLVERRAGQVELRALDEPEWRFLQGIAAGNPFADACDRAHAAAGGFDLDVTLANLIAQSTLVDFVLPRT